MPPGIRYIPTGASARAWSLVNHGVAGVSTVTRLALNGFGCPSVLDQVSHDIRSDDYGSINRLLDRHFSENFDRHYVREVHRRYRRARNRRSEIVFRLSRRVDPVRNGRMIEQHVQ